MRKREGVAIFFLLVGFGLSISSVWIIWDWINSLSNIFDMGKFVNEWGFDFPFFVYHVNYNRWTLPYDISLFLYVIGLITFGLGCYYVGYCKE
jgi:hypothetical protein